MHSLTSIDFISFKQALALTMLSAIAAAFIVLAIMPNKCTSSRGKDQ